jgi:hypothetical protein
VCAPLDVLTWVPNNGALDVPVDTIITLELDDYPEPETVGLDGFIARTGVYYHPGTFGVDLIDKTITFRASGNLRPNLGYTVTIGPPLASLSGCLVVEQQHTFHTSATTAMPPAPPAAPAPYATTVAPIFARSCGGAGCHRAADGQGCLATPAAALSLCDRDAVAALVGVPSLQVSALALVAPADSARSYLLRKLLPGATPDRPAPTALGHRDPPGAPLSVDDLRTIARWIDAGALP